MSGHEKHLQSTREGETTGAGSPHQHKLRFVLNHPIPRNPALLHPPKLHPHRCTHRAVREPPGPTPAEAPCGIGTATAQKRYFILLPPAPKVLFRKHPTGFQSLSRGGSEACWRKPTWGCVLLPLRLLTLQPDFAHACPGRRQHRPVAVASHHSERPAGPQWFGWFPAVPGAGTTQVCFLPHLGSAPGENTTPEAAATDDFSFSGIG